MQLPQLRLIPVTVTAVALLFGLKVTEVWHGASVAFVSTAGAETAKPDAAKSDAAKEEHGKPAAAKPEAANTEAAKPELARDERGKAEPAKAEARAAKPDVASYTEAEVEVLQNLTARREALATRDAELDMREKLLSVAEKRVDERIAELKKLEAKINALVRQRDEEEEKNLRSLVKVYENMKPKDAARIFEKLELDTLLGVVERMKEAKLAPVLAEMDASRAQQLTVELAKGRQLPGPKPAKAG